MTDSELGTWQRKLIVFAVQHGPKRGKRTTRVMQDVLRDEWPNMPQDDQKMIQEEIRKAHHRQQMHSEHTPGWLALLELPLKKNNERGCSHEAQ